MRSHLAKHLPHEHYSGMVEDIDARIVSHLARDGRMSLTDLGKATGLSTSAVHQRVRRLEQRGVIRGYRAVLDPQTLGLALTAFVSIKPLDPTTDDTLQSRLGQMNGIEACYSVAGDESYILKVRVSTPSALEVLLAEIRSGLGVSTRTTVVLSTVFEDRLRPLDHPRQPQA